MKKFETKTHRIYTEYSCNSDGVVYKQGKLVNILINNKGGYQYFYIRINKKQKQITLSRFVWECWVGDIPYKYYIKNIDGDKENNKLDNLELGNNKDLVYGWGINDCPESVTIYEKVDGVTVRKSCPVYSDWSSMLERCFCPKFKKQNAAYAEATICEEWKYLSNFKHWVLNVQLNKDWMNCEPDKDLLSPIGEKLYSPTTVVYISKRLNTFLSSRPNKNWQYMIGATWCPTRKLWIAQCSNAFDYKASKFIGVFDTEIEAHLAWKAKKHEYACKFADMQDDPRVASALRVRFSLEYHYVEE